MASENNNVQDTYTYDEDGIPTEHFNGTAMLANKEWWLNNLAEVRKIFVKHLGEHQDYTEFDRYVATFDSHVRLL